MSDETDLTTHVGNKANEVVAAPASPTETALISLTLRQSARNHLGLNESEHWPSGVAVTQARAVLASDWLRDVKAAVASRARADTREQIAQAIEKMQTRAQSSAHVIGFGVARQMAARIARADSLDAAPRGDDGARVKAIEISKNGDREEA